MSPAVWLLWLVPLLLVACGGPGRAAPALDEIPAGPTPAWIHQPLSWDKLEAIAAWLDGPGRAHEPRLVIEGELQLNEGRVLFTDRDLQEAGVAPDLLRSRADRALAGFDGVLANPAASRLQIQRAETGRRAALALLDGRARPFDGPRVVSRAEWGSRPANERRMTPARGGWQRITVHHSAEPNSPLVAASLGDSTHSVQLIQKYHMEDASKRWGDVGYHFMIDSSGRVFEGRQLDWQGAHAGGANNRGNIGVCLLGNYLSGRPPQAAVDSLEQLIAELQSGYGIPRTQVFAHNNFANTECPGAWLTSYLARYR